MPEATFVTLEGLADFQAAAKVQMDDGINFLQEMIAYRSVADATQTAADRTSPPAPDGHDRLLRHLDRQYQAAVEIVLPDAAALGRFATSPAWQRCAGDLAAHCSAVHVARDSRCITTQTRAATGCGASHGHRYRLGGRVGTGT